MVTQGTHLLVAKPRIHAGSVVVVSAGQSSEDVLLVIVNHADGAASRGLAPLEVVQLTQRALTGVCTDLRSRRAVRLRLCGESVLASVGAGVEQRDATQTNVGDGEIEHEHDKAHENHVEEVVALEARKEG